ncbi:MAG: indole-3-glycerol phosphate synthase TrpC [Spartobacteria bacterium]|nr:indole-3-glycerol phosphate synthase TrpC [Spartobacteria bacterium]
MNILEEIVAHKRVEIAERMRACPLDGMRARAAAAAARPPFVDALRAAPMGLIAEVKRRSPSKGSIREGLVAGSLAGEYEAAGAQAISCLMDNRYFGGGEADFREVRAAVHLPMLYKEFVVEPWQVWHAVALGASAVLLIVAALDKDALLMLMDTCREAGIETLVEVHNVDEMKVAAALGAACIGINNRDLKTFTVSLDTTLHVKEYAPEGCTLISESGIRSADDVARLRAGGVHGILVGEHLLRQQDVSGGLRDLMRRVWGADT